MIEIRETAVFSDWLLSLRDAQARHKIQARIKGHGPGHRVYYSMRGAALVILLCGGDKSSQNADIAQVVRLAKEITE